MPAVGKLPTSLALSQKKGDSARSSFEATILHLRALIESGSVSTDGKQVKKPSVKDFLEIEHFSQEQIVEALLRARAEFLARGMPEVARKLLITQARDIMSSEYGLRRTVLKPAALTGIYAAFDGQMQRFFKRMPHDVKSGGPNPDDPVILTWPEGWTYFEAWQRGLRKTSDDVILMLYEDVRQHLEETSGEGQGMELPAHANKKRRLDAQIGFLRGYFVDISFDDPESGKERFGRSVFRVLSAFDKSSLDESYWIFFGTNDMEAAPPGDSHHFDGVEANIFCRNLDDVDFASAMTILPYDRMIVRNKAGKDWSEVQIKRFLQHLKNDLAFDDFDGDFAKEFDYGPFLGVYAKNPYWER
ncbi:hypothetical protein [Muricoccus nepalensis]|uniref:hypothetical protein n=1 Tax=Muricoccus nepalensis TaxID=1854500 RepID=UPI00112E2701|nr:hypothetical protein [Roseomonas nepalensis]